MTTDTRPQVKHHYQSVVMDSARWEQFQRRPDDIIISTSYKAGTTWLQGICAALVFQTPEPPVPQDDLSPWLDALFAPFDEVQTLLDGLTNRRYIKTHLPLDAMVYFDDVKYLVVGRDGRDVFASMWNHWNNLNPDAIDEMNNDPKRSGPRLPHPPEEIQPAFDDWLSKSSFEWESDGFPFWSHLYHAQSWVGFPPSRQHLARALRRSAHRSRWRDAADRSVPRHSRERVHLAGSRGGRDLRPDEEQRSQDGSRRQ
jgi:aryl sulfotransferase